MKHKKWLFLAPALLFASLCLAAPNEVRLYTLDCGQATFQDMSGFSATVVRSTLAAQLQALSLTASMGRIETILKNTNGRLIVQHDIKDYDALPKPPAYLD